MSTREQPAEPRSGVEVPGSADGDVGLPVGPTDTPAGDTGDSTPSQGGVSGREPGAADLENPGGTGLTTADTEGAG